MKPIHIMLALALAVSACASNSEEPDSRLKVVGTFSIVSDIVTAIGGDHVTVHSIVPIGVDPHEYSPLPADVQKTAEADVVFWNGLNMEVGDGWFESLIEIAEKDLDADNVVQASTGVEPKHLGDENGSDHQVNPHAFLDPNVGMIYAKNIRDGLIDADPERKAYYQKSTAKYLRELKRLDAEYRKRIAEIPSDHQVLVTSENAYQYMTDRYGLTAGYIWEIDTDEQGTPQQISDLVALIRDSGVPALFVESNVDKRPMESISKETGVPIAGELYSDELGKPSSTGGTYLKMLQHNIDTIHAGLT